MMNADEKMAGLVAKHTDAVVIGLGLTGYSVVRYLAGHGLGVKVVDTRSVAPFSEQLKQAYPDVPLYQGQLDDEIPSRILDEAGFIIVSPGLSVRQPSLVAAAQRGADIVGDIELFAQQNRKPCVAITGSNGKSTVTTLVGEILTSAGQNPLVGGNIGMPVLDSLTDGQDFDVSVLELSSFQLETTHSLSARVALLLNISDDHLDRYDDLGDYLDAKLRILDGATLAILNRDDNAVYEAGIARLREGTQVVSFGLDAPESGDDYGVLAGDTSEWLVRGNEKLIDAADCPLPGRHNIANTLAGWAAAAACGVPDEAIAAAVQAFKGLPHRSELIGTFGDVTWVNDSKATNPGATVAALNGSRSPVILIAGGQGKGADYGGLAEAVAGYCRAVILIGEDADLIARALPENTETRRAEELASAISMAEELARPGDMVILSPACASFDMFEGYAHRGDEFRRIVLARHGELTG